MQITTSKRSFWLQAALLICALPLVALAQQPEYLAPPQQEVLPPPVGTPLKLSPSLETPAMLEPLPPQPAGMPPLTSLSPEGEIKVGEAFTDPAWSEADGPPPDHFPFGYNLRQSGTTWLVGDGDDFGMFSLEALPTLARGANSGFVGSIGFHFLGGPIQTDMPPRLFDFQLGYQRRGRTSETFGYDVAARVGAFSDFEGSARQGIRFPAHAVGYYRWAPRLDLVFGLDYLDRDDIGLLPVAGLIFTPRDDLRLELVFPRPRIELRTSETSSIYLGGELGGGTWAIERAAGFDDVATYRDLRLLFGFASRDEKGSASALEIGYVFARDLSYRSGDAFVPDDTLLIRSTRIY